METLEAFKLITLVAIETVVVALVGATVIAGLYQLIRDRALDFKNKLRASQAKTPTAVHEPAKRL